jgi:hypothetical protein
VVFCGHNVVIKCKNAVLKWPFFGGKKYATCFNYFFGFFPQERKAALRAAPFGSEDLG